MKTIAAALLCMVSLGPFGPSFDDEDDARPDGDWIDWHPTEGLVLDKRLERTISGTVKAITLRRDDEEEVEEVGQDFEGDTTIVLRDVYEEAVSHERLVVLREFNELTHHFGLLDGSQSVEETSPFEGLAVRMVLDLASGKNNSVMLAEDSPSDEKVEELLPRLMPFAGDLVAFRTHRTIEIGDTWDVDWNDFKWDALKPSGDLAWESDPPNPGRAWVDRKVFAAYEGEIEATYARRGKTEGGDALAVVTFEGTFGGDVELDVPVNAPAPGHVAAEYEVEGTVEWNLARSLPHRFLMTIRGTKTETHERENENGERYSLELVMDSVWEDEFTYE